MAGSIGGIRKGIQGEKLIGAGPVLPAKNGTGPGSELGLALVAMRHAEKSVVVVIEH